MGDTMCAERCGGCLQSLCGHLVISQLGMYDLLVAAVTPDIAEPLPTSCSFLEACFVHFIVGRAMGTAS